MNEKPNRRTALTGLLGLAAGLFAAPAAAKAPKTGGLDAETIRQLKAEEAAWELDRYGAPGSAKVRLHDEILVTLLPAYREVAAAMNAALDADYETTDDSYWTEDVDGVRFYVELFATMLEGDASHAVEQAAEAELARRIDAHKRGAFHHCAAFWGDSAIKRAKKAAYAVADRDYQPGGEPCFVRDVRYQAWLLEFLDGAYGNEAHCYMNDAASDAWRDGLYAEIDADRTARQAAAD